MSNEKIFKSLKNDIRSFLKDRPEIEIFKFFIETKRFTEHYVASYELNGELYLVLDNSLIQEIKHRKTQPTRAIKAEAYLTFCKFVKHWSDRVTYLALSPMAIYEHFGRRVPKTIIEIHNALLELNNILSASYLEIRYINFHDAESLYSILLSIANDELELTKYIKKIDKISWKTDLSAPRGVKIPMSVAAESLPPLPILNYFHPWYVHFVLTGRVEQYIIDQSRHNPNAMPIESGELTILFSKLNTFRKNILQGLGDIDIFQICDVSRQYREKPERFFIGQSLDKDLIKVLSYRHSLCVSSGMVIGGSPDQDEKISDLVKFMFSNPFEENEVRGRHIRPKYIDFMEFIADICKEKT
ncbi:hypothetical protein [uncultured Acinetobacter sp.]|uniref:hypothetical protein n=1 Tax=uncultured Acinetobacter sp. TaxID=165433 RepID=UPI003748DF8C